MALCNDPSATLDDVREAVTTLEDAERTARRVFGGEHPLTVKIEQALRLTREGLVARDRRQRPNKTTIYFLPRNSLCRFGFCFGASVDPYSR